MIHKHAQYYFHHLKDDVPVGIVVFLVALPLSGAPLFSGLISGLVVGLFFVIKANYHAAITLTKDGSHYVLSFNKDVSFLNKDLLRKFILDIEANSRVTIDASKNLKLNRRIDLNTKHFATNRVFWKR